MTDGGIDMDRVAIFIMANPWNTPYTKTASAHIVNNEIVNANDGVMPLKLEGGSNEADYEGLVIHNNHIYLDERVYTDCNGNRDPAGPCSDTEDAIDVRSGAENPLNPMILSNNRVWGFRWTDVNSGGSGSPGSGIRLHFKVKNVIIKNNVIFNSYLGIFMGSAKHGADGLRTSACSIICPGIRLNWQLLRDIRNFVTML